MPVEFGIDIIVAGKYQNVGLVYTNFDITVLAQDTSVDLQIGHP